jgi:hypothetical protein
MNAYQDPAVLDHRLGDVLESQDTPEVSIKPRAVQAVSSGYKMVTKWLQSLCALHGVTTCFVLANWLPLVDALRTFLPVPTSDLHGILDHPWAHRLLGPPLGTSR